LVRADRGIEYEFDDIADLIAAMEPNPAVSALPAPAARAGSVGRVDFSPTGTEPRAMAASLTSDVHEGGTSETNRWSEFSRVAGYEIHLARHGHITLEEAANKTRTWMGLHMLPPWPEERFRSEFMGVLRADIETHGDIPEWAPEPPRSETVRTLEVGDGLSAWDIGQWAMGPKPQRRHLVQGLVMAGQTHLVAAEGGVGKTFLMLDLGLRLAAAGNGAIGLTWLGQEITHHAAGGTVIIITSEDAQDELHIRLADIDPDAHLRHAAAGRLRIVPLTSAGGAFPLVGYDARRNPVASTKWALLRASIAQIAAKGRVSAVIVDTLASTLHGEDISSEVITEYFNELGTLCGEYGASVLVTHHTRKGKKDDPIRSIEDMKEAVRGSGAVLGSPRVAIGVWPASDWRRRLQVMGERPQRGVLYLSGVVKANNPEMLPGLKTLMRQPNGLLIDVSERDRFQGDQVRTERMAWLVGAVRQAAVDRHPLSKTSANGLFARRSELPEALKYLVRQEVERIADDALGAGLIVRGRLAGTKGNGGYLDVPGGPITRSQGYQDDGVWSHDWTRYEFDPTVNEIVLI